MTKSNFTDRVTQAIEDAGTAQITQKTTGKKQPEARSTGKLDKGESPDDTSMSLKIESQGQSIDMRVIGSDMFVNMGDMSNGKFVKADLSDRSNPIVQQFGALAEQIDPVNLLQMLDKGTTDVEASGSTEEIDGVQTQPYQVTVDPAKVSGGKTGGQTPETVSLMMYVDSNDLLYRISSEDSGVTSVTEFTHWGDNLTVDEPDAENVTDELPGQGQQPGAEGGSQ